MGGGCFGARGWMSEVDRLIRDKFFEHIQDTHDAIESLIDLEEDLESGGDSDFDTLSRDCFDHFIKIDQNNSGDPDNNISKLNSKYN